MKMETMLHNFCRPHGFEVIAIPVKQTEAAVATSELELSQSDCATYELHISGRVNRIVNNQNVPRQQSCKLMLTLPNIQPDGSFSLEGVKRSIVKSVVTDYESCITEQRFVTYSTMQVFLLGVERTLAKALTDWFYSGNVPMPSAAQPLIDIWLRSSNKCQRIADGAMAKASSQGIIHLDCVDMGLDVEARKFPAALLGTVDPSSTSSSDKINLTFRTVKGTVIRKQKLVNETDNMFCTPVQNNIVGTQYSCNRTHMLRAQYEQVLQLTDPERPLVEPEENVLSGRHLLTALMDYKDKTYEDAVAISEQVAKEMTCIRRYNIIANTAEDITLHVKVGNSVNCNTILMEFRDSHTGRDIKAYCKKLEGNGIVKSITAHPTKQFSRDSIKYSIKVETIYALEEGDKITTRGAIKGVVTIVPTNEMPVLQDGTRIECMIAPECIYKRQSITTLWEMMAARKAENTGMHIQSRPFKETETFKSLASEGYGETTQLFVKNEPLPYETFVGPLFVLRLDKLANETVSWQKGKEILNEQGLPVNNATDSGQRRDLAMTMNMQTKGLDINLEYMIKKESKRGAPVINAMIGSLRAIDGPRRIPKPRDHSENSEETSSPDIQ